MFFYIFALQLTCVDATFQFDFFVLLTYYVTVSKMTYHTVNYNVVFVEREDLENKWYDYVISPQSIHHQFLKNFAYLVHR